MNNWLCPEEFITVAMAAADAAGEVVRRYFRTPVAVDDKEDSSPVTIADKETEQTIRAVLQRAFPEHGIIGEEFGITNDKSEYVWVIDPIDGTKSFITGKPSFGTLIALLKDGYPVLGIIDQPITRERWLGSSGRPSTLNGAPIKTRACSDLKPAILYSTGPDQFSNDQELQAFHRLAKQVKLTRYGCDCYAYGLLSLGFVDIVCEAAMKIYDFAALIPVIEGAGGMICDWNGNRLGLQTDGRVLALGDATLKEQALSFLKV